MMSSLHKIYPYSPYSPEGCLDILSLLTLSHYNRIQETSPKTQASSSCLPRGPPTRPTKLRKA
uniref:Uncharacterized protein n=1 Tax=Picea glauca TaxID=3330 RepID=A0A101LVZ1_PICGL|nr:hypothetical protein ABT39_MTgene1867 [Picea glauca]